jgi:esterase
MSHTRKTIFLLLIVFGQFSSVRNQTLQPAKLNTRAIEALVLSSNPFPFLSKSQVKRLRTPTLLFTGADTIAVHKTVDEELARLLPNAISIVVPNSGLGIARENRTLFISKVLEFLSQQK